METDGEDDPLEVLRVDLEALDADLDLLFDDFNSCIVGSLLMCNTECLTNHGFNTIFFSKYGLLLKLYELSYVAW